MNRVVVLGGTGFVGHALCEKLSASSASVRIVVPTRRLVHAQTLRALPTVDVLQADVHDDVQLARVLAGADAVVNLVAILHGSAAEFDRVHVALPRRVVQACVATGVKRVVHVSALGVAANAPSKYLASKAAGEAVLQQSPLALTLLRPSVIFGAEDHFLNLFATLQAVAPVMPLAGSTASFQPVWVDDVAAAIVACLQRPETAGKTYECAGPGIYTLSRLVYLAGLWSGHERVQLPLPAFMGRLQALALELLPGTPLMSRDNIESMKVPNVASGQLPGLAALGITPAALEAVAPQYLGAQSGRARLDRLRALARRG
jgi:NADH dehydrogenase